jgi:hypothetical protein
MESILSIIAALIFFGALFYFTILSIPTTVLYVSLIFLVFYFLHLFIYIKIHKYGVPDRGLDRKSQSSFLQLHEDAFQIGGPLTNFRDLVGLWRQALVSVWNIIMVSITFYLFQFFWMFGILALVGTLWLLLHFIGPMIFAVRNIAFRNLGNNL